MAMTAGVGKYNCEKRMALSYRLAFQPNFNLITNNYFSYINAFTLVHLSVFEFASIFA